MVTVNTATHEAVVDALVAAVESQSEVPMLPVMAGARRAVREVTGYLQEFAAGASFEDLVAEIDALHRSVTP